MAFTMSHARQLAEARALVGKLEAAERDAFSALRDVLLGAGIGTGSLPDMAEVVQHAEAIRDALEPFDSGVRPAQDQSE